VFLFVVVWINDDDTVLILAWSDLVMKKNSSGFRSCCDSFVIVVTDLERMIFWLSCVMVFLCDCPPFREIGPVFYAFLAKNQIGKGS
jgi:hypothetical protein